MNIGVIRRFTSPLTVVGTILIVLGAAVLIGWQFHYHPVTSLVPRASNMQPLTALEFALVGSACWLLWLRINSAVMVIGGIVALLGLTVFLRIVFHGSVAPDHLLFPIATKHSSQSVNVALSYFLTGCMLFATVTSWRYRFVVVRSLAIFIIMLSLLAIITFTLGIRTLPGTLTVINMAIHTSVGFFLIGSVFLVNFGQLLRQHIRKRVVWLFFALCVIILVTSAFGYKSVQRLTVAQQELQKRIDFQTALSGILNDTLSVETGQRGYLLTGDTKYLQPYNQAYKSVGKDLADLGRLSAGNPEQRKLVQQLIAALIQKDAELKQTIQLKQEGNDDQALDIVRSNIGQQYENNIRNVIQELQKNEDSDYNATFMAAQESVRHASAIIVLTSAINIALIAIVLQLILQEAAERGRRQAELEQTLELVESQRKQNEALLSSIGDGVFAIDQDGIVILFNKAASDITGFNEDDVIGKHYSQALRFTYEKSGRVNSSFITKALRGRKANMANHTTVTNKTGSAVPVADSAAPIIGSDGQVTGAIVVFRDITKEYAVEKAKDEFMALASHQLRTPATGVKQYLSMLIDGYGGKLSGRQVEMIDKAYSSNERQLQIVDDMLNVASADAGRMTLHPETLRMSELIHDIAAEQRSTIEGRKQSLTIKVLESVPPIQADPHRLRMAIENILSNASKYTPAGGSITIQQTQSRSHATIQISDTGVGISKEQIEELFQKFVRVNNDLSAKVGGSGLGLYLAQHIIQLHRGAVTVESTPGSGTTFTVTLPVK